MGKAGAHSVSANWGLHFRVQTDVAGDAGTSCYTQCKEKGPSPTREAGGRMLREAASPSSWP